jgi:hypothetical protein
VNESRICCTPMKGWTRVRCKKGHAPALKPKNVSAITKILYNATNALLNDVKESVGLVVRQLCQIYGQKNQSKIDKENDAKVAEWLRNRCVDDGLEMLRRLLQQATLVKGALSWRSSTRASTLLRYLPSRYCFSSCDRVFFFDAPPPSSPFALLVRRSNAAASLLGLLCRLGAGVSGMR